MRAAILSVGDELTLGATLDTNAQWLAERLARLGVETVEHRTVGDDRSHLAATIRDLAERSDLLVITGGLGPTKDDLTRHGLGDVIAPGRDLLTDDRARRRLEKWFAGRVAPMPAGNLVQAQHPEGAELLDNPNGTAPGLRGTWGVCTIVALPGPPHEMKPMFETVVTPFLTERVTGDVAMGVTVRAYGIGESDAAERLDELMDRTRDIRVGTTVSEGVLTVRIAICGQEAVIMGRLRETADDVASRLTPYVFGQGPATLAEAAGAALLEHGRVIATAESCTGGWLGAHIVDVAGSSDWYAGGWVTYTDGLKETELGVPRALLDTHGTVSGPVACAMADGARERSGATDALAITGIAGPSGGTPEKPVGTVFVAHAAEQGTSVRRFRFRGDRRDVRQRSVSSALQMLRWAARGEEAVLLWERPVEPVEGGA